MSTAKFRLGQIFMTPGASKLDRNHVTEALKRHVSGDFGEVSDIDQEINEEAVKTGDRILSAYISNGVRFWIITEAGREITTILLPEEY
jgi:hypothetical protein